MKDNNYDNEIEAPDLLEGISLNNKSFNKASKKHRSD